MTYAGHLLRGPNVTVKEERAKKERWCFGCRQRLGGTWRLLDYDAGSPHWGYYEPIWQYRCDGCGDDRRDFPGCEGVHV